MAPMAVLSLIAKMAVGQSLSCISARAASPPDSMPKVDSRTQPGFTSRPASAMALR